MTETSKTNVLPVWMVAVNLILLVAAFILNLICLSQTESEALATLDLLCCILTTLAGAYYCFSGYKKNGALFFKMFVYCFSLSFIFVILSMMNKGGDLFAALCMILTFGALCILAAGTDLGLRKSFLLSGAVFFLQLIAVILFCLHVDEFPLQPLAKLLLSALLNFIIYAKYMDKLRRHRKV